MIISAGDITRTYEAAELRRAKVESKGWEQRLGVKVEGFESDESKRFEKI